MKVSDVKEANSIQVTVGTKGKVDSETKDAIEQVRHTIKNEFAKRFRGEVVGEVRQSGQGQFGIGPDDKGVCRATDPGIQRLAQPVAIAVIRGRITKPPIGHRAGDGGQHGDPPTNEVARSTAEAGRGAHAAFSLAFWRRSMFLPSANICDSGMCDGHTYEQEPQSMQSIRFDSSISPYRPACAREPSRGKWSRFSTCRRAILPAMCWTRPDCPVGR